MNNKLPISVSLVIPVYNNSISIKKQLPQCITILSELVRSYEIIIINDASTDETRTILKKFKNYKEIKIFHHKKNQGITKTFKQLYASGKKNYTLLFSLDGDWNPYDIRRLIKKMSSTSSDMIIGTRKKSIYSSYRKSISFLYNFLPKLFFGVSTIDAGSIKIIKTELLQKTYLSSTSVFFDAELIIKLTLQGKKISHIPISFQFQNKKATGGKLILALHAFIDCILLRITTWGYHWK